MVSVIFWRIAAMPACMPPIPPSATRNASRSGVVAGFTSLISQTLPPSLTVKSAAVRSLSGVPSLSVTETWTVRIMARAIVCVDGKGKVVHTQLVPEIGQEPDYDAALGAFA